MSIPHDKLMQIFDAADLAAEDFKALMADGKIDWNDWSVLIKISGQFKAFTDAVHAFQDLKLSDLAQMSPAEIAEVVARVKALLSKWGLIA